MIPKLTKDMGQKQVVMIDAALMDRMEAVQQELKGRGTPLVIEGEVEVVRTGEE
jgi:hypothetical protein